VRVGDVGALVRRRRTRCCRHARSCSLPGSWAPSGAARQYARLSARPLERLRGTMPGGSFARMSRRRRISASSSTGRGGAHATAGVERPAGRLRLRAWTGWDVDHATVHRSCAVLPTPEPRGPEWVLAGLVLGGIPDSGPIESASRAKSDCTACRCDNLPHLCHVRLITADVVALAHPAVRSCPPPIPRS
jgi:hypothetical protein